MIIEKILDNVIKHIRELEKGYLITDFAESNPSIIINHLFVGKISTTSYLIN